MFPELSQLVTFNPTFVTAQTPLDQLLDMHHSLEIRHWPVVDGNRAVMGVVTETDIVRHTQSNMLAAAIVGDEPSSPAGNAWRPSVVADIMTPRAITVDLHDSMQTAVGLFLEHQFQSLPVTDNGRLSAMVTTADFLREFSYGDLPNARDLVSRHAVEITDTVEANSSLNEALLAIFETGNQFVAVSRGGCPLGVVSHRELAKARCREIACELTSGSASMTLASLVTDAIVFKPGVKMADAAQTFLERNREGALVVNQANRIVGMLTVHEILRAML